MTGTVPWDAAIYERVAEAQYSWALEVLAWRTWRGDERVLDAGCGPGRVAEELVRRLPRGQVVAVDRDPDMLQKARRRFSALGRASVVEADLEDLPELGPFDVVLSTAVLHWVPDHDAVFRGFHRVLRPGGEVLAQFGGQGNIASLVKVAGRVMAEPAFAPHFADWVPPWHFDAPEATAHALRGAGFDDVRTHLEPKPTAFDDRQGFLAFCQAAPLRPYMAHLPPDLRDAFVAAVGTEWESAGRPWTLDYVRLNARARRP